jgi:hypothetical protein
MRPGLGGEHGSALVLFCDDDRCQGSATQIFVGEIAVFKSTILQYAIKIN